MRKFGDKKVFAIEYELRDLNESELKVYVDNQSICTFIKGDYAYDFEWAIGELVEWFETNIDYILNEEEFPLPVDGSTAIELYQNSGTFDSDDESQIDNWYEIRQDWSFRHSWYSSRAGGYLADLYFRKAEGKVEIAWNNVDLYEGIKFLNPVGLYYIEITVFQETICDFINGYKLDYKNLKKMQS